VNRPSRHVCMSGGPVVPRSCSVDVGWVESYLWVLRWTWWDY